MKRKHSLLALLFTFCYYLAYNQCDTPTPDYSTLMTEAEVNQIISAGKNSGTTSVSTTYSINITFHIIRKSDGSDGATVGEINEELARINAFFAPSDIQFILESINEIWNDAYAAPNADWFNITKNTLRPTYGSTSRIDAFIFNSAVNNVNGNAFSIPSDYFAASENRLNTGNWPHEIGHDLGLLHTHERYGQSCPSPLIENVNGSNCATAGDLCCDTPADPNLDNAMWSLGTCTYTDASTTDCNGSLYSPNVRNLMSYGWTCRDHFTTCQMNRMHAEIMSGNIGSNLVSSLVAVVDGDSEVDGTLRIDRPATFRGDVPLVIDATNSTGWYSGFKTTYATNSTYVFGIDHVNGGIEVVKQNFYYAPMLASQFVLAPASDIGINPSSSVIDNIDAIAIFKQLGKTNLDNGKIVNLSTLPTLLKVSAFSSPDGRVPLEGISLNNWLVLSSLCLQQMNDENLNNFEEKTTAISLKNQEINKKIHEAQRKLAKLEKNYKSKL